jgi:hypothetical protein
MTSNAPRFWLRPPPLRGLTFATLVLACAATWRLRAMLSDHAPLIVDYDYPT